MINNTTTVCECLFGLCYPFMHSLVYELGFVLVEEFTFAEI